MREAAGEETSTRRYHVRLTKGNEEGQEDEKTKVKEDELNMCTATAQRKGGRKRKRREGERRSIVLEGQLSPSVPV